MIITQSIDSCNLTGKNKRAVYNLKASGRRVYKSTSKQHVLRLRGKRVANTPLYNNETLTHDGEPTLDRTVLTEVKVGLLYRGAERTYMVPVIWKKDYRGNYRRHITRAQFLLLPRELQETAIAMGVDVSGKLVTFSRCVVAWAGYRVTGMHVHHVNMDTTDDRLGNLWVMTPSEHAAVHADKDDLLWDEEWYEYNSCSEGLMRLDIALLGDDDYARDIVVPNPEMHEIGVVRELDPYIILLITELQDSMRAIPIASS